MNLLSYTLYSFKTPARFVDLTYTKTYLCVIIASREIQPDNELTSVPCNMTIANQMVTVIVLTTMKNDKLYLTRI